MPVKIIDISAQLEEVELLGRDAEVIANDVKDVIDIVIRDWHDERYLPGAMVPVILNAVDRALLQQMLYFKEQLSDPDKVLKYIEDRVNKISTRILLRVSKKSTEAAA